MSVIWDEWLQPAVRRFGFDIRRHPPAQEISWDQRAFERLISCRAEAANSDLSKKLAFLAFCAGHAHESHSQIFQDLFVRFQLSDKQNGYFVEFGATDGVGLSNTKSLETLHGWKGIVAEPARVWHERLAANRSCIIEHRCVWSISGQMISFNETEDPELSTTDAYIQRDLHAQSRVGAKRYEVGTISLVDLLAQHHAPDIIDYLSIDTEGSEYSILSAFDFNRYRFRVITVEHNMTADREKILNLLSGNGYRRVFPELTRFDDWYVFDG